MTQKLQAEHKRLWVNYIKATRRTAQEREKLDFDKQQRVREYIIAKEQHDEQDKENESITIFKKNKKLEREMQEVARQNERVEQAFCEDERLSDLFKAFELRHSCIQFRLPTEKEIDSL